MKLGSVKLPATSTFDITPQFLDHCAIATTFLHRFLHSFFGVSLHGFEIHFFLLSSLVSKLWAHNF
jgi:hypothetical protein